MTEPLLVSLLMQHKRQPANKLDAADDDRSSLNDRRRIQFEIYSCRCPPLARRLTVHNSINRMSAIHSR